MRWLMVIVALVLLAPQEGLAGPAEGSLVLRRFALIAGANDGGGERVKLLYAHSDARAIDRVLRQLGGVSRNDRTLLLDASREDLLAAFGQLSGQLAKARQEGVRVELVFYYSGHSDEKGLLLSGEHVTYKEVRAQLDKMPADVRIAILDSCSSGTLTRSKGGVWRKPFLVDESAQVTGHAFLTSASADEAAQESDRVKGSFFTHYMISGLRGAADVTDDGRVTLNEAYQYAFHETLARTEATQAGPQHPSYDFQLTGAGDLVLTDLSKTSALLIIPAEMEGRLFLRDDGGRLVAEINKPGGRAVSLGVEAGDYSVSLEQSGQVRKGLVALAPNGRHVVAMGELGSVPVELAVARGGHPQVVAGDEGRVVPFSFSLVPGVGYNARHGNVTIHKVALNLLGYGMILDGFELSALGAIRTMDSRGFQWASGFNADMANFHGFQAAGGANIVGGNFDGFQAAGGANIVGGDCDGFQAAGGANIVGGFMSGMAWAGGVNIAGEGFDGSQMAPANIAGGDSDGFQGGVVNIAGNLRGVQLGVVNIASELDGPSIGLLNFIGNGIFEPALWYSDTSSFNVGIKMGSRSFYSTIGVGFQPGEVGTSGLANPEDRWLSTMFGLGGHLDFGRVWLDIDLVGQQIFKDYYVANGVDTLSKFRTTLGLRLFGSLSLFAGPTLNVLVSDVRQDIGYDYTLWEEVHDGVKIALKPGFIAGIQVEPNWGRLNSQR